MFKCNMALSKEISKVFRTRLFEPHKMRKDYKRISKAWASIWPQSSSLKYRTAATFLKSGRPAKISSKACHRIRQDTKNPTYKLLLVLAALALDNTGVYRWFISLPLEVHWSVVWMSYSGGNYYSPKHYCWLTLTEDHQQQWWSNALHERRDKRHPAVCMQCLFEEKHYSHTKQIKVI